MAAADDPAWLRPPSRTGRGRSGRRVGPSDGSAGGALRRAAGRNGRRRCPIRGAIRIPDPVRGGDERPAGLPPHRAAQPAGRAPPSGGGADMVKHRTLPPVAGEERKRLIEQAETDFIDYALISNARWS